ncbi:hypothetical protein FHS19_001087 [Paenibacillus rhizosphaerae]|uniref:Uncharacterized protein n=1 Tax=Paenibacillus rhizosphaerae TaxID=297318 RepID=A0A839TIV8_9BACL|nr:hypothetical protein [Paenibacillus rhizosphaerae]
MRRRGAVSLGFARVCWTAFSVLMTTPNLTFGFGRLIRFDPFDLLLIDATLSFLWKATTLSFGSSKSAQVSFIEANQIHQTKQRPHA